MSLGLFKVTLGKSIFLHEGLLEFLYFLLEYLLFSFSQLYFLLPNFTDVSLSQNLNLFVGLFEFLLQMRIQFWYFTNSQISCMLIGYVVTLLLLQLKLRLLLRLTCRLNQSMSLLDLASYLFERIFQSFEQSKFFATLNVKLLFCSQQLVLDISTLF